MSRTTFGVVVLMGVVSLTLAGCSSSGSPTAAKGPAGGAAVAAGPATGRSTAAGRSPAAGSFAPAARSSAPTSAAAGGHDVCSLMTSAQASAINHVAYGTTKSHHVAAGYDSCTYANTGKHADPIDIQQLSVGVITVAGCYPQLKQVDGPGKPVSGIGDEAFGYSIGVMVRAGSTCLDISGMTHAEFQDDYSHDVAMAKIILGNLPH